MTPLDRLVDHLQSGQRFVLSSHQRPDGDAIGSSVGLALALQACGKEATVVMEAVPPHYLQPFPHVDHIHVATKITDAFDGALIMECGSLDRTGVAGLDRSPVLNIDHHVGNRLYGAINWIDESAAACTELVFTLVERLGVTLSPEMATHIYLGVLTDTGSFRFSHLSPRTFDIARRCIEAGANPQWIASTHYDSSTLGRVRVFGQVLNGMRLDPSGQVAVLSLTTEGLAAAGATMDDTEGLINFPLSVKSIQAVIFFKQVETDDWRVSMRSKGDIDVAAISRRYDGGGHRNAAGCSAQGALEGLERQFVEQVLAQVPSDPAGS